MESLKRAAGNAKLLHTIYTSPTVVEPSDEDVVIDVDTRLLLGSIAAFVFLVLLVWFFIL
jgi:hypothetical protein